MKDKVLIANGQGFWGDSILGPVRLVQEGPLDYLTLDYLAEVTLSIMQKLRSRDPKAGYATDFVRLIDRILPQIVEKDIKVIANAGGVNPHACKDALLEVIAKHGVQLFITRKRRATDSGPSHRLKPPQLLEPLIRLIACDTFTGQTLRSLNVQLPEPGRDSGTTDLTGGDCLLEQR